ncbi:MAG: hypothetical protein HQL19_02135 [Candidatus Omnitrophica bacterium]|nr:hypothetical protein [Candidatus Omnitrophota bacterium]
MATESIRNKQENKDWQKDYVATLLKLEEKLTASAESIVFLTARIKRLDGDLSFQNMESLRNQVKFLKHALDQIMHALPAEDPAAQSIQRDFNPYIFSNSGH